MKRLLVIRSVSFQQLDLGLPAIRARFPTHEITVLTHEHGLHLAETYAAVSSVIVYPHRGPFRRGWWSPAASDAPWDDVVVPVANVSGAGFANVFDFARSLTSGDIHRCNVAGEIVQLDARALRRLLLADRVNRLGGAVAGSLLGGFAAACFLLAVGLARLTGPRRSTAP